MSRSCLVTVWVLALIGAFNGAQGALILVGTDSGNDSLPDVIALVNQYNGDGLTGSPLPIPDALIDKIEDIDGTAAFENGVYGLSDFDFYQSRDSGTGFRSEDIFDANVEFDQLIGSFSFDEIDNNVLGFVQKSGSPPVGYYATKSGQSWSLWYAEPGFNPDTTSPPNDNFNVAYADSGTTRGRVSNTLLSYDPVNNGVSHISFYGASAIPEPSTAGLFAMLSLVGAGVVTWRKRKPTGPDQAPAA